MAFVIDERSPWLMHTITSNCWKHRLTRQFVCPIFSRQQYMQGKANDVIGGTSSQVFIMAHVPLHRMMDRQVQ